MPFEAIQQAIKLRVLIRSCLCNHRRNRYSFMIFTSPPFAEIGQGHAGGTGNEDPPCRLPKTGNMPCPDELFFWLISSFKFHLKLTLSVYQTDFRLSIIFLPIRQTFHLPVQLHAKLLQPLRGYIILGH